MDADPGPAGRERVRDFVSQACNDDDFVAAFHFNPENTTPHKVIYEDKNISFVSWPMYTRVRKAQSRPRS